MRKIMLWIIIALITTNLLTLIFWRGGDETTQVPDQKQLISDDATEDEPVVAIVDDERIHHQDWQDYLESHYGETGLREMINHHVIQKLAEQHNIQVDPAIVDLEVSFLATVHGELAEDQIKTIEEEWRREIEDRLLTEMLFTKDVTIPEEEIREYYDTYERQYNFSQRIELSHIVVDDLDTANRLYQELEEGADFKALAYEYTIDEDSRATGGYIGFFATQSTFLPTNYLEEASNIAPFSYTEPFLGNQGYVILYLHRELPELELEYDQIKDHIRVKLAIEELEETPSIEALWEEFEIDWIY